jgi:DNA-binding MarR family transcriptional regulator
MHIHVFKEVAMKKREPVDATPCLCALLRSTARAVSRKYDAGLRPAGIRVTQYSILSLLKHCGELRQQDLALQASLEETSVTRTLQPLLEQGWIETRSGNDRRERFVKLTPAGRAKIAEVRPVWAKVQKQLQKSLATGVWQELFSRLPELAAAAAL